MWQLLILIELAESGWLYGAHLFLRLFKNILSSRNSRVDVFKPKNLTSKSGLEKCHWNKVSVLTGSQEGTCFMFPCSGIWEGI